MSKLIKPAISSFKSEGSDTKRVSQMVREESDFKARLNWLEKQFQMFSGLCERMRLQDQKIQTLQDEQDNIKKMQHQLVDDLRVQKVQNFNGQDSCAKPQIDSSLMKSFLNQLEYTVSDVMKNQSQRLAEIENQLGQINNKFSSIKKDILDDKIKIEAQNIANEQLKKERSKDKLEILKKMQFKDDIDRNYSSIFETHGERYKQNNFPSTTSEMQLQGNKSHDSSGYLAKQKLHTDDELINNLANKLYTKDTFHTQWCPIHNKYPDMQIKQNKSSITPEDLQRVSQQHSTTMHIPSHHKVFSFDDMKKNHPKVMPISLEKLKTRLNFQESYYNDFHSSQRKRDFESSHSLYGSGQRLMTPKTHR